jgi:hypothetical protein
MMAAQRYAVTTRPAIEMPVMAGDERAFTQFGALGMI